MNTETSFNLSYDCRHSETRDVVMSLNVSFENASEEVIKQRINTWLKAIGFDFEVK
jgi:hypothetical protein